METVKVQAHILGEDRANGLLAVRANGLEHVLRLERIVSASGELVAGTDVELEIPAWLAYKAGMAARPDRQT